MYVCVCTCVCVFFFVCVHASQNDSLELERAQIRSRSIHYTQPPRTRDSPKKDSQLRFPGRSRPLMLKS